MDTTVNTVHEAMHRDQGEMPAERQKWKWNRLCLNALKGSFTPGAEGRDDINGKEGKLRFEGKMIILKIRDYTKKEM